MAVAAWLFAVLLVAASVVVIRFGLLPALMDGGEPSGPLPPGEAHHTEALEAVVAGLGLVRGDVGAWVDPTTEGTSLRLEGRAGADGRLQQVHRLVAHGPWGGIDLRNHERALQSAVGDTAFDAVHLVEGPDLGHVNAEVRSACMALLRASVSLRHGTLTVVPADAGRAPDGLEASWVATRALVDALDRSTPDPGVLLHDPNPGVRAVALTATEGLQAARDALASDGASEVRLVAALRLHDEGVLRALLHDPSVVGEARSRALAALPRAETTAVIEMLVASDAPALWWDATRATGLPGEVQARHLRSLVRPGALDVETWPGHRRVPHVAERVIAALASHPVDDAEAVLVELLRAPSARVQVAAARALGQVGTGACVAALRAARLDASREVAVEVESALQTVAQHLGGPGALSLAPLDPGGALSLAPEGGLLGLPSAELPPQPDEQGEQQEEEPEP